MSVRVVELGKYTTPKISENKREKWVSYGDDNNYYQTLIDAKDSPTNSALINGISDLIYGQGLYATDAGKKPDEYAGMIQLFSEELMRKICDDYYTFGQASMQVIYSQDRSRIVEVAHMPIQNLRPEKCNEEGDIAAYYYSDDWAKVKKVADVERIPAFGFSREGLEVLVIKPYKAGFHYFSPVEYQSGIDYAFVEIELAQFHLNNIHKRFSPNLIINFNNGVPEEDQQVLIENKIKNKFTGTEGESIVIAFNQNKDEAADIQTVQLNDAHNQYQFIAEEAARKLMVSHRVVSPLLFGLPQNGGLGSNADEIKMAAQLFDSTVIKPMQRVIIESVKKILAYNEIALDVYMVTSQPLEFSDKAAEAASTTTFEQNTGVALSAEDFDDVEMLEALSGENVGEEWELVDSREVSENNSSIEEWANSKIKLSKSGWQKFADFITSKPSKDSNLDKSIYKVRYSYEERYSSDKSRQFCKSMMRRTANGVVYRLEDIDKASREGINREFGHKGQAYDLFKFKGGVNCGHYWQENLYRLKKKNGEYVEDKALSSSEEVASIPKSYQPTPSGHKLAPVAPKDMPNNGHHPNYKR